MSSKPPASRKVRKRAARPAGAGGWPSESMSGGVKQRGAPMTNAESVHRWLRPAAQFSRAASFLLRLVFWADPRPAQELLRLLHRLAEERLGAHHVAVAAALVQDELAAIARFLHRLRESLRAGGRRDGVAHPV